MAKKNTATAAQLDFTNVKDAGQFNKKHQAPGDYRAKITSVADARSKGDNTKMWVYTIQVGTGTYPLYCKLQENQLWKVRNLFVAAGKNVPKKRVNVDPNLVVGKTIGVTLEDEEYEGRMQSQVQATFPESELEEGTASEEDDDLEGDEDEDEADAATPDADDDDDEDDAPPPPKKSKKDKATKAPQGGTKKKSKKVDDVDDDELEELEIEDI